MLEGGDWGEWGIMVGMRGKKWALGEDPSQMVKHRLLNVPS